MKVTFDLEEECLKDSPRFRAALKEADGEVTELEVKLDKLVQLCVGMIDAGKAFCAANKQFVNGIRDLAQYSSKDVLIESGLTKFSDGLQEVINYHTILFDQAQRSIKTQLQIFIKDDLRKFKDAKKQFDEVSEEKENALVKNARVKRTKLHEVEEATNILIAKRKRFRHIALDNVLQINALQSKQRSEILKSMLSFMYAHLGFFHLGFDLFRELEPVMKDLGSQLHGLVVDAAKEKRDMEQKHSTIQQKDFTDDDLRLEDNVDEAKGIVMEGYLFKRTSNTFKTWNRRWFSIQNNLLAYQKKMKDSPTVVVEDLRLCTVKYREDIARRFCFEVVSPTKSCMLQADSEKLRQAWVKAVQTSIATAYSEKSDETEKLDKTSSPSTGSLDSGSEVKEELFEGASIATAYSEKSDETEKLDKTSSPSTGSLDSGSEVKEELFEGASIATAYSEKSDETEKLDKTSSPSTGSLDSGSEVKEELFEGASIATAYSEKSDETEKLDKTSSPSTGSLDSGSEVKEELFEGASIATAYSEKSDETEKLDKTSSPSTGSLDSGSEVKEELFEGASIATAYSEKSDETEKLDKTSSPYTGSLDSGSEVKEELFEGASIATAYSEKSDETEKLDKTSSPYTGSLDSGSEVKEELFEGASIATAYTEKSDETEKLDKTSSPSTGSLDSDSEVKEELFEGASIATAYSEKSDETEKLNKTSSPSTGSLDSGSEATEELFEGASIATAYSEKSDETEKLDKTSSPSTGSLDSGSEATEELFEGESALQLIQCIAGNSVCCDCGLADPPWASINLGIILCIECAGIHRSLGVHFSKVRSLTLDTWEPELLMLMLELGNQVINQIYEAKLKTLGVKKPDKESPRLEKEEYIRAKYVEKRFVNQDCVASHPLGGQKWRYSECKNEDPNSSEKSLASQDHFSTSSRSSVESNDSGINFSSDGRRELLASTVSSNSLYEPVLEVEKRDSSVFQDSEKFHPGLHLYRAAYEESLPDMAEALAHVADVNWENAEENNATPLIQAVHGGSLVACEFLLQNGANVNHMDLCGRGPLHHATVLGHTGQVCLFLKRWANQHAIDEEGEDPLTIAVEAANTDIVTLLRGARMNEEMRESEGLYGQPGDETYQDILRDFSYRASNNPEKLNRFQPSDTPKS